MGLREIKNKQPTAKYLLKKELPLRFTYFHWYKATAKDRYKH